MSNPRLTTVELQKENMKFSAGHFTIFSAIERETLHGHNYQAHVALTTELDENGLTFDYRHYKKKCLTLCRELNRTFLLPEFSKYLRLENEGENTIAYFNDEKLTFLTKDITIIPVTNVTVEELAYWFTKKLLEDKKEIDEHLIQHIHVKVFSGPGQSGSADWDRQDD